MGHCRKQPILLYKKYKHTHDQSYSRFGFLFCPQSFEPCIMLDKTINVVLNLPQLQH